MALAGFLVACGDAAGIEPSWAEHHQAVGHTDAPGRVLWVDAAASPGGNGSRNAPYATIAAAIAESDARGGGAIVRVAPGDYTLAGPLRIQQPIRLVGSGRPVLDADGWPTGEVEPGTETSLMFGAARTTEPLIWVGSAAGPGTPDVTIEGFTFEGPTSRSRIEIFRAQNFTFRDNVLRGPASFGVNTAGASGAIVRNYVTGMVCGNCIAAGSDENPADVRLHHNRAVGNQAGGLLLNGMATDLAEGGDELEAHAWRNDLSNNNAQPVNSFGVRIMIGRRDPPLLGSTGHITARLHDNRLVGNRFGLTVDAGFPYRTLAGQCIDRVYSGSIDLRLHDNVIAGSLSAPALISFTRNTAAVAQSSLNAWQYLHETAFTIDDPDNSLAGAWIDHPEHDPFPFPTTTVKCAGDLANEALGNSLVVNGIALPNERNLP